MLKLLLNDVFKNQRGIDADSLISFDYVILLSRAVVPLIQGYEDAGDFTLTERLKTSIHVNLVFYLIVGSIGLLGLILLITMRRDWLDQPLFVGFFVVL